MIQITELHEGKADLCREVLDDLPEWFGIPESTAAYVEASAGLSMLAAHVGKQPVGFVSLKHHTKFASELYVLGVKRRFHRQGAGRALIEAAEKYSLGKGTSFLTVKTLGPTNPAPHYAATRRFYEAVGFVSIEVFPTLWGTENPCLLMIKSIAS
jgi:ribosomal protein S18 acetylase RimI-like enzyme